MIDLAGTRRPRATICLWLAGLAVMALLPADSSHAHTRSLSHSSWRIEERGAVVTLRIPRLELTRVGLDAPPGAGADALAAGRYLADRLGLESEAGPCLRSEEPTPRSAPEGSAAFRWRFECPGPPRTIGTAILLEVAPSHLHFARILSEERIVEQVLTEGRPTWRFVEDDSDGVATAGAGGTLLDYIRIGVEHILSGWDHLAFVLALLLLTARFGELARLITGFTIAHSVTLALAVLGVVHPRAEAVEAVIAFSVALVAIENGWILAGRPRLVPALCLAGLAATGVASLMGVGALPVLVVLGLLLFTSCHFALLERSDDAGRLRAALAFAFGLVHGFGFAGILGEMALPTERLAPALFGFNVGVELGQLAVVAIAWPALRALARVGDGSLQRMVVDGASAAICGIGIYWFVVRSFGA